MRPDAFALIEPVGIRHVHVPRGPLVEQGETGESSNIVYLVLDGVLEVIVDGEVVGELGPGAIVGERAALETVRERRACARRQRRRSLASPARS
jgi:CRP-like cAMP-binding protein